MFSFITRIFRYLVNLPLDAFQWVKWTLANRRLQKDYTAAMTRFHGFPSRQTLRAALRKRAFVSISEALPRLPRQVRRKMADKRCKLEYQALMGTVDSKV